MADYIDRQTAIDKINERQRKLIYCFGFENDMVRIMDIARSIIIAMPSIDAIEVVKCKDCKHWDISDIHSTICSDNRRCKGIIGKMYTAPDYYCAFGERKDG